MACEEPALSAASTCVQSSTSPRILPKPMEEAGGGWRLWLNSISSTSASMAWGEKSLATTDVACRLAASAGSPKPQPNCTGNTAGVVGLASPRSARRRRPHARKQCCRRRQMTQRVAEEAGGGTQGRRWRVWEEERGEHRHLMHLLGAQRIWIAQAPV